MSRCHRTVNKLVGGSRDLLYEAYDKGYEQGKIDYQRHPGQWSFKFGKICGEYECSECKKRSFAPHDYCHICGAPMVREVLI